MPWVTADFETASSCDLKKAGAARYAEDATTEILCLVLTYPDGEPFGFTPDDLAAHDHRLMELVSNADIIFDAHNVSFEKAIWRNIMVRQYGWPDIPNKRWQDTMARCGQLGIPMGLEHAALALRLPVQKDTAASKFTIALSKPREDGSYDRTAPSLRRVADYCAIDVRTQAALRKRVGWLDPSEQAVWQLDQRINERGVRLDLPFIQAAQAVVDAATGPLAAECRTLTGGISFSQRDKLLAWANENGAGLENLRKETLDALLGSDEDEEPDGGDFGDMDGAPVDRPVRLDDRVRRVLAIRRLIGSASVKKLARMDACICSSGRAYNTVQFYAAGTGRWGGRLFQPQNFPRSQVMLDDDPMDPQALVDAIMTRDAEWVESLTGMGAVDAVIRSLRHAIIADPGRRLCAADFSAIEARVDAGVAGEQWVLDAFAETDAGHGYQGSEDMYLAEASKVYGYPCLTKKTHKSERQDGKTCTLAFGYQGGVKAWRKFDSSDKWTDEEVNDKKTAWRDGHPNIVKLWYGLEDAALKAVKDGGPHEYNGVVYRREDRWLTCRLPSGRKLYYFDPKLAKKAMPWDTNDIRVVWSYSARKGGRLRTVYAYGGHLTENVVQAVSRDLMVTAMFKAERNGFPVVLTVHDELLTEPDAANADHKALEQIMADHPQWAIDLGIPIKAEGWTGERYHK